VIVALVGNITGHGSAVLLAAHGELKLSAEIGLASIIARGRSAN
jgi:Ca2+/H+ antiporter